MIEVGIDLLNWNRFLVDNLMAQLFQLNPLSCRLHVNLLLFILLSQLQLAQTGFRLFVYVLYFRYFLVDLRVFLIIFYLLSYFYFDSINCPKRFALIVEHYFEALLWRSHVFYSINFALIFFFWLRNISTN